MREARNVRILSPPTASFCQVYVRKLWIPDIEILSKIPLTNSLQLINNSLTTSFLAWIILFIDD